MRHTELLPESQYTVISPNLEKLTIRNVILEVLYYLRENFSPHCASVETAKSVMRYYNWKHDDKRTERTLTTKVHRLYLRYKEVRKYKESNRYVKDIIDDFPKVFNISFNKKRFSELVSNNPESQEDMVEMSEGVDEFIMLENGTIVPLDALDSVAKNKFQIAPRIKHESDHLEEALSQNNENVNQYTPDLEQNSDPALHDYDDLASNMDSNVSSKNIYDINDTDNKISKDAFEEQSRDSDSTGTSDQNVSPTTELPEQYPDETTEEHPDEYISTSNRPVRKRKIPKKYKDTIYDRRIRVDDNSRKRSRSERENLTDDAKSARNYVKTLALWDVGISLNKQGEVSLAMPDSIRDIIQSGGSININFDVRCLDSDNCLKFKVTDDEESINTALESDDSPKKGTVFKDAQTQASATDKSVEIVITQSNQESNMAQHIPEVVSTEAEENTKKLPQIIDRRDETRDVGTQVHFQEENATIQHKPPQIGVNSFVSYARFSQPVASSTVTIHKVLKNVKRGLSVDSVTKRPTWFCSLCNLTGDYGDLGPLFGPFSLNIPSTKHKSGEDGAKNLFDKINRTLNKVCEDDNGDMDIADTDCTRQEVWLHENCVCWSPGVYLLGLEVYGLEEIFHVASATKCSECKGFGASLGCFKEDCNMRFHYLCALKSDCKMIEKTFTILCSKHSTGVVENILDKKPILQVRNYLSKEELEDSEYALSSRHRPGRKAEVATEPTVKITKTKVKLSDNSHRSSEVWKHCDTLEVEGEQMFGCKYCSRLFTVKRWTSKVIRKHLEARHKSIVGTVPKKSDSQTEGGFMCRACCRMYTQNRSLRRHLINDGHAKVHEKCLKQPDLIGSLQRTPTVNQKGSAAKKSDSQGEGEFMCMACYKVYTQNRSLRRHLFNDGHAKVHEKCLKQPDLIGSLREIPITKQKEGQPYKCEVCQATYSGYGAVYRHYRSEQCTYDPADYGIEPGSSQLINDGSD